jgi:hypothetical protein
MAALTLVHPSASSELPIDTDPWLASEPQGEDDKQLRANAQRAIAHWWGRAEHVLGLKVADGEYVSVPFTPVKKVRVTYRLVGALKPAPYPLDE